MDHSSPIDREKLRQALEQVQTGIASLHRDRGYSGEVRATRF